jgi:CO/xanthine dehydrogenase Mo-binding subunit
VELELDKDGILEIRTSAVSGSRETAALWRRVAAETLALKDSEVRLADNRSDLVPDSGPSSLSRNIVIITKLIERCCLVIRKQRFRDPLPITVRRVWKAPRSQGWSGLRMEGNPASLFSWAAAIVEVEIDQILYIPKVRGVWLCVDGGRIFSERKARSSLENSVLHALGWVRQEHMASGNADPGASILAYDIAAPGEAPPIVVDFSWNESTSPKGIGELPFGCVPPAYAQAVSQASGIDITSLPLDPCTLRDALEET